jgi:hypothetical protein
MSRMKNFHQIHTPCAKTELVWEIFCIRLLSLLISQQAIAQLMGDPRYLRFERLYPRRREILTIYWCQCKGSPFSIVLRPWVEVWPWIEPKSRSIKGKHCDHGHSRSSNMISEVTSYLPEQCVAFREYPSMHWHWYDPGVLTHFEFAIKQTSSFEHSSMSTYDRDMELCLYITVLSWNDLTKTAVVLTSVEQ